MLKTVFVTFGDGSADFRNAAERLARQAMQFGVFHEVWALDKPKLTSLSPETENLLALYRELMQDERYLWSAKSLILSEFEAGRIGTNCDLLFYADAGCEMRANVLSREYLKFLLGKAQREGGYVESTGQVEKHWTKLRTLQVFPQELWELEQLQSTWFIARKTEKLSRLARSWAELSNPELGLWQDPQVGELIQSDLIEHRHDQSLFSLLWKSLGLPFAKHKVNWLETNYRGSIRSIYRPILAIRNRSGETKLRRHFILDAVLGDKSS